MARKLLFLAMVGCVQTPAIEDGVVNTSGGGLQSATTPVHVGRWVKATDDDNATPNPARQTEWIFNADGTYALTQPGDGGFWTATGTYFVSGNTRLVGKREGGNLQFEEDVYFDAKHFAELAYRP